MSYVGAALSPRETKKLVIGRGSYVGDLTVPGLLHAAFVRSPHAHALVSLTAPAPPSRCPSQDARAPRPPGAGLAGAPDRSRPGARARGTGAVAPARRPPPIEHHAVPSVHGQLIANEARARSSL